MENARINLYDDSYSEFPSHLYKIWIKQETAQCETHPMYIESVKEGWEIKVYIETGELWDVLKYGNRKNKQDFVDVINKVKSWFKKPTSMRRRSGTNQDAAMDEWEACNAP